MQLRDDFNVMQEIGWESLQLKCTIIQREFGTLFRLYIWSIFPQKSGQNNAENIPRFEILGGIYEL
jgi:hypothetical protein